MHVQVGDDIRSRDQIWQLVVLGCFDLSGILAQFRRDVLHTQGRIDLLFAVAENLGRGLDYYVVVVHRAQCRGSFRLSSWSSAICRILTLCARLPVK